MNWLRNLSLKFKLIMLLVMLTGTMLATFGWIAIRDFEKDKIAYVLDSGLAHSRSVAAQVRSDAGYAVEKVKFLLRGYDPATHNFHPYMAQNFTGEARFDALMSFYRDKETGEIKPGNALKKSTVTEIEIEKAGEVVKTFAAGIQGQKPENDIGIAKPFEESKWLLTLRFDIQGSDPLLVAALLNSANFLSIFETSQIQDTYLVTDKNEIVITPKSATYNTDTTTLSALLAAGQGKLKSSEGIYQYPNKNDDLLVAAAGVGMGGLKVVSIVPKSAALEAVRLMVMKSALFLIFLFCITIALSILSSTKLTASLKKLLTATKEIAKGNFQVSVDVKGGDEVGSLSDGFNKMAGEISRLMIETAEKARMEGELKTAQLVQQTLFPKDHLKETELEIKGFYEPASECSGDWWFYKKIGNHTMFCIGDATGHGVPAALLTAAARSAAAAIEKFPGLPLHEMMEVFNSAIYNTAQGKVMMTLFLGLYDHETGVVDYCNASHEPPYLVPNKEGLKKKDLQILHDATGPRMGESENSRYQSIKIQLTPGDKIVLYTDGVTELRNKAGDMWGERSLIKCLIACHNDKKNLVATMDEIANQISTFREKHPLQDDVTYFMLTRAA